MFFGLGLTTSSTATVVSLFESIRSTLATRVLEEGGTIEGSNCFTNHIKDLTAASAEDIEIIREFCARVSSENGVLAGQICLEDFVEDIIPAHASELQITNAFVDRVVQNGGVVAEEFHLFEEIEALNAIT